jgi:hypothetical protein
MRKATMGREMGAGLYLVRGAVRKEEVTWHAADPIN